MVLMRIVDLLTLIVFIVPLPFIVYLQGGFYYYSDYVRSQIENDPSSEVFDFIVVGSGAAGSVVANRLSKNSKVLLLEAGGDPLWYNYVPAFALPMLSRPQVDWIYETVPQKFSQLSMANQQGKWPRGKVLGGSTTLNYMFYVRSNPLDYDNWANKTGDSSWNYENLLPYFKKSLIYKGSYYANEKHYGTSPYGFLHVENRTLPTVNHDMVMNAARELGYEEYDLNGPQQTGFGPLEVTLKKGARCSTYTAFLEPILDRQNLRILRYAQATKIKLDSKNRASGVWYVRHGKKHFVTASKEVIISAGSIDSPKLLMLSGIGPKKHLQDVGIKPKADLPVGHSLKDHIGVFITPFMINKPILIMPEQHFGVKTFTDYFLHGTGHLTFPSLINAQAFLSSSIAKKQHKDWPDIQLYFSYAGVYERLPQDFSWLTGVKEEYLNKFFTPFLGKHGLTVGVALVRPKSSGSIRLVNRDPATPPAIDPRYLEHPDDIKILVEGLKTAVDIIEKTKSFQEVGAKLPDNAKWPACEHYKFRSDDYWECLARNNGFTVYHPVSTCKMGEVVDTKLRVLKVRNLRVVDASIMPEIVNGNTNAPTILIGEKGSDMIREYWSEQFLVCDALERLFTVKNRGQCFYTQLV